MIPQVIPRGIAARAAAGLPLAAAPTFAVLALLTANGAPDMLCMSGQGMSLLSGMGLMYALMSAFHFGPWLKLVSRRR